MCVAEPHLGPGPCTGREALHVQSRSELASLPRLLRDSALKANWAGNWVPIAPTPGQARDRIRSQWRPSVGPGPKEEATGEPELAGRRRPWADAPLVGDVLIRT